MAANPIEIRGLDHLVLRVRDLDTMLHFYVDILGCVIERRLDDLGLTQLRAGVSLIDLVPVDGVLGTQGGAAPDPLARNVDHFCLRVDNFAADEISAYLREHGLVPGDVGRRYGADGYGQSIYIADPEGNVVELKGPPES